MIAAALLIVTIILSKTKKIGAMITPKIKKIAIALLIIAILVSVGEYVADNVLFDNSVKRPSVGEADTKEELELEVEDITSDIELDVPATPYSNEDKKAYIERAKEEIDETFLGDNDDLDEISLPVVMKESYADGLVKAAWQLSDYKIIGAEGEINYDKLTEPTLVEAEVTLTMGDMTDVYSFNLQLTPLDELSPAGIEYYLRRIIKELSEDESDKIVLPGELNGHEVKWSKKYTYLGAKIALLAVISAVLMVIGQIREEKNKHNNYLKSLSRDYPKIVESLALYVGAGLSVKNAIIRMCEQYVSKRGESASPGYEGLLKVKRDIEEGRSELNAYELLGVYCPTREYKRLSSLITNNLRKGTKGLIDELNKEEEAAFEMEQNYVKIAGEEASTKLLFPMIGLLGIVLIIIIAPSVFNMNAM